MALDLRTPVLVGVGQSIARPVREGGPVVRPEPLDLMVEAFEAALSDAGAPALRARVDRLCAISSFTWKAPNPALALAERLGIEPAHLIVSATGGTMPQELVAAGAEAILAGESQVIVIAGAEAMYSRSLTKRDPTIPFTSWTRQDPTQTTLPERFGMERDPLSELEHARGLHGLAVEAYPILESALRARNGWSIDEHRDRLGRLWESFAAVAAENPFAWIRDAPDAATITSPTLTNRMVSEPYTKLLVANLPVDLGAALVLCSLEVARSCGISDDRMVFPLGHACADDHFFLSERPDLDRSPAIRLAGLAALGDVGVEIADVAHVDLYSCFPVAVEIAADALGLDVDDPGRPLTVTGGLTFAGGPGNNFVSHSIAAMAERLRANPGALGLVTGLGYFASRHSVALYSSTPPRSPFRSRSVQDEVDALPRRRVAGSLDGVALVEAFTVFHERDGTPSRAIVALCDGSGTRSWGTITALPELAQVAGTELCGRPATLRTDGQVSLHS